MYGYIYKTTNLINGKIYIGKKTKSEFDPNYKGSGKVLKLAFEKYGWENFEVEFLCPCFSLKELNAEERCLIAYFDSRNPEIGYNRSEGGDWGDVSGAMTPEEYELWISRMSESLKGKILGYKWMNNGSEEIRVPPNKLAKYYELGYSLGKLESFKKHRSDLMRGESNTFYNKSHSAETKKLMSEAQAGRVTLHNLVGEEVRIHRSELDDYLRSGWLLGESDSHRNSKSERMKSNNPMKGKRHSEETKARMRLANKGRDMSNRTYHNKCQRCGIEFVAKSARTRYCDKCRKEQ